jgi:hypothetical protein
MVDPMPGVGVDVGRGVLVEGTEVGRGVLVGGMDVAPGVSVASIEAGRGVFVFIADVAVTTRSITSGICSTWPHPSIIISASVRAIFR